MRQTKLNKGEETENLKSRYYIKKLIDMKVKKINKNESGFDFVVPGLCCCCCFFVDCSGRDRDDKPAPSENTGGGGVR